jgi:heterotetrameric sarcosine oxidase gamma subunit
MAESSLARSPLGHFAATTHADAALSMRELPFCGVIDLRLDQRDKGARDAAELALVVALPEAGRSVIAAAGSVLWLGPDEFLIVTEPERQTSVAASLLGALRGRRAAVIDISDSRTIIALSGVHARDVLAKGCGLDLHPRSFAPGQCARSSIAKAGVALYQLDDAPTYHILVERSLAEYLWLWLADAAAGFRGSGSTTTAAKLS